MPEIFRVIDPRGNTIVCTDKVWSEHILANRPWMKGWEKKIIAVLTNPFAIYDDGNAQVYYKRHTNPSYYYIKVVVKFNGKSGNVITAYPCDHGKSGEKLIWPGSSD